MHKFLLDNQTGDVVVSATVRSKQTRGLLQFSFSPKVEFVLNLRTGQTDKEKITIPVGKLTKIDIKINTFKRIIEGDIAAAVELIPNPGGVVRREIRSDYASIRRSYEERHLEKNVYFASEKFVRWASIGTAGRWVANAVGSGGGPAFAAAMKEAQRQSLKELTAFQAWLQSKGEQNANQLAKQLLTGQQAALPTYIAIKWQTVVYASKIKIAGVQVGPNRVLPNRHAAFVFIWKGAGGSRKSTVPSNIDNAKIAQISDDGGGVLGNGNGNGNNAGNTDRKKIQLTSLHCIETEDFFGADESYLVVWVDGRKLQTFRRDLNDGHTLPLNLSIEFSDAVTLELWDLDEPDVGDSHDFLGQVTISKNELSGVKFFTRDGANYRVTWKKGS